MKTIKKLTIFKLFSLTAFMAVWPMRSCASSYVIDSASQIKPGIFTSAFMPYLAPVAASTTTLTQNLAAETTSRIAADLAISAVGTAQTARLNALDISTASLTSAVSLSTGSVAALAVDTGTLTVNLGLLSTKVDHIAVDTETLPSLTIQVNAVAVDTGTLYGYMTAFSTSAAWINSGNTFSKTNHFQTITSTSVCINGDCETSWPVSGGDVYLANNNVFTGQNTFTHSSNTNGLIMRNTLQSGAMPHIDQILFTAWATDTSDQNMGLLRFSADDGNIITAHADLSLNRDLNPVMSWLSDGKVGIGTTAPATLLDVDGSITGKNIFVDTITFSDGITIAGNSYAGINIGMGTTGNSENSVNIGQEISLNEANAIAIGNQNSRVGTYSIAIGNSNSQRVDNVVSIGNNQSGSGRYAVSLGDNARAYLGAIAIGEGSFAQGSYSICLGSGCYVNSAYTVRFPDNYILDHSNITDTSIHIASGTLTVDGSGAGIVTTGGLQQGLAIGCSGGVTTDGNGVIDGCVLSDKSVKTNIKPLSSSAAIIDKLNPVGYSWTEKSKKDKSPHAGFIAQEVRAVYPQAAISAGKTLISVDPNAINALLVKEVQDLRKRVAALEKAKK